MPKNKDAAANKKSKKRAEKEDEDGLDAEVGDAPMADAEAEERATQRKQKKQKKKAEPEEEEEPPHEEDGDEEDDDGNAEEKAKKKLRRQREHKKVSGYRAKAAECGFRKGIGVIASSGVDMFASALTPADAKRLMRFVPEVLNKSTYDKNECAARMKLSQESVPPSAARETQARCEAVLRKIMNEAVMRSVEKGVMRIDAATVQSVLRQYQYNMTFSSVLPPLGLIRHAQGAGILSANAKDEAGMEQETKDNKELSAAAKQIDKAEEARKEAFAKRKKELANERAKAAA
jgi:hypothetical protein